MTYRRLFHILSLSVTLAFGALWWNSLDGSSMLVSSPGAGTFTFSAYAQRGTLGLTLEPDSHEAYLRFYPPVMLPPDHPTSRLSPVGMLHYSVIPGVPPYTPPGTQPIYLLQVPVWLPWLVLVACLFAFTRIMEWRVARRKQPPTAGEA